MNQGYDAVIIGAGAIGACVAKSLAERGWRTLSVDRLPAAGYGSTGASCAIVRTHYSTLDGAALAHEGYYYWKDWPAYIGVDDPRGLAQFRDVGCLVMKTEGNRFLGPICRNMDALGIPYQHWDRERILARFPFYDLRRFGPPKPPDDPGFGRPAADELPGAVFFPLAGYITDPGLAAQNAAGGAEARGAVFRYNARVVDILRRDGRAAGVRLDDGSEIAAAVVVNVAGPHSAVVNRMAGVEGGMKIKTRALKQEVCHVPAPAGVDYEATGMVTSDNDIGCYARPETGNHILIGSEDPECDLREWVDPDDWDDSFTEQWQTQVLRKAQRARGLPVPGRARGVVALYDVADDWIPIYDKSDLKGFYMAVGTSGNQFKNAPVAGELMAELIGECEAGRDHDARPVSFRLKHTGRDVDLGFYSRRRQINPDSSFSVLG